MLIHAWNHPTDGSFCGEIKSGNVPQDAEIRPWNDNEINCPACLTLISYETTSGAMTDEEKTELRLDQEDEAERIANGGIPWCEQCQSYHHATAEHIKRTVETIDITPVGLQTPEGVKRVLDAQQEWDSATHALANAVKDLNWNRPDEFTRDETHQILALIGARDRKQEAFLRAIAGQ